MLAHIGARVVFAGISGFSDHQHSRLDFGVRVADPTLVYRGCLFQRIDLHRFGWHRCVSSMAGTPSDAGICGNRPGICDSAGWMAVWLWDYLRVCGLREVLVTLDRLVWGGSKGFTLPLLRSGTAGRPAG